MSEPIKLAVRAYPIPKKSLKKEAAPRSTVWPDDAFVFDCETRIDALQSLTFGSYRYYVKGRCIEEGLFYGDGLDAQELACLEEYARMAVADVATPMSAKLHLRDRRDFLAIFYHAAFKARAAVVGFNLPFDLSRLAFEVGESRVEFAGGFSFALWDWTRPDGSVAENKFRPRIAIKHIDSKRALKGFTKAAGTDKVDLIPEDSISGKPDKRYGFRGHFLDLRTLAFALTDRGHSLASACTAFGVEHGKIQAEKHGTISLEYIDYSRRDVMATSELYFKLMEEYVRHPISLQPTKAFSPASIGKAYLREMGVKPALVRQPDFPIAVLGNSMSAFFGGRTGAHIRRTAVPVVYCDFLSMYPTVNTLMGLWRFVIASKIELEDATREVTRFLATITPEMIFDRKVWRKLPAFVQLVPDGDILPARIHDEASNGWQVGVNYLHAAEGSSEALWYALPDVVSSVLLSGRLPKVLRAIRLVPRGRQRGLRPIKLRGEVQVDPRSADFFKTVIEERKRLSQRDDLTSAERERLDLFLKVLANATSYGILAEMVRKELPTGQTESVTVHGRHDKSFNCRVSAPEEPGEFCFPPLAALITSAARLQLALLERYVTDLGGTYAMEDTDSMAFVATEVGGHISCPGGALNSNGESTILALSWKQVRGIARRFDALNPYDPTAVPGSILKIEDDNFDPASGDWRPIHCFAISAKRYALFVRDGDGHPALLQKDVNNRSDGWSEHGLGHLLNPTDPSSDDRAWIRQIWERLIHEAEGRSKVPPTWLHRPALSHESISSYGIYHTMNGINRRKPYRERVKPFNFILSAHIAGEGHPTDTDPTRFHLIAPYESNSSKWERLQWIDKYSGSRWRAATELRRGTRKAAVLKAYLDVANGYAYHPESKSAAADGSPCDRRTRGLLRRRHVAIGDIIHIGKESNRLADVEMGAEHDRTLLWTEYVDSPTLMINCLLSKYSIRELSRRTGLARSTIQRHKNIGTSPSARSMQRYNLPKNGS